MSVRMDVLNYQPGVLQDEKWFGTEGKFNVDMFVG